MAELQSNMKPRNPARVNAARCKAFRCGFAPKDTTSTGKVVWSSVLGPKPLDPSVTWTTIKS